MLLVSSRAAAAPADPRETVRGFFAAWAAADVDEAAKYWASPSSPEFDRRVRRAAMSCTVVHDVRIGESRALADGRTEVPVELLLTRDTAMPGSRPQHANVRPILRLRHDGDAWRIVQWSSREEQLAEELLALQPAAVRAAWVERHRGEATPELVRVLAWHVFASISQSEFALATELGDLMLRLAAELGDDVSRAYAMATASHNERAKTRPNLTEAVALADEGLAAAERAGDPDALAFALLRRARATRIVEDTALLDRALGLADSVDDLTTPALAAHQLAYHYGTVGENRLSLLHAGIAARHAETAGSRNALLSVEMVYGALYRALGDPELSALHYERAYGIARELGYGRVYISFVDVWVEMRLALGHDPKTLLELVDAMIADPGTQGYRYGSMNLWSSRAKLHIALGDLEQAESDIAEALAQPAAVEYPRPYFALAELRMRQGRYKETLHALDMAPTVWGVPVWAMYADAARAAGDTDRAMLVARCGIEHVEEAVNRTAGADRSRQTQLAKRYPMEQVLVEILVERGESREALVVAEAAKARVLRDAASSSRSTADAGSPEAAAERALADRVETLNRAVLAERDEQKLAQLRADLAKVRLDLDDRRVRALARVRGHELYTAASSVVRWPFRDTVALQYMVGERQTIIFAVRSGEAGEPRLDVEVVPVPRDEIASLVQQLRDRIAARDFRYRDAAARLYEILIAPVESALTGQKTVCVVPDGELWKVPFHALRARNGEPLLDRVAIFYAPSIQLLNTLHGRRDRGREPRLLALGNPTVHTKTAARFRAYERSAMKLGELLEAETEVNAIARIYGQARSTVYVRDQAREALFKDQASGFDILHVAAHGLVDDNSPGFSALLLAASNGDDEDGLLEAREVADLKLNADLVVLSACDTAAGRVGGGEGLLGLSWAFLAAGADGLVGSQWKAPSAATELLMVTFHQRLHAGDSPAEALRQAQRRLLRDDRYDSPLDWAPFVVVGDGL
ncbi:MAG TPA: CHAT domain-containing protein [Thermoanaerobaculia bacterium]